jgi:hypothetical protein
MLRDVFPSLCVLPLLWATAAAAAETREWDFQMLLDDREVGKHRFLVQRGQDGTRVRSEAKAEVRILAIPFYRYHHLSEEQWSQGCVKAIRARTEKNGETDQVSGARLGDLLRLDTPTGAQEFEGCVRSFAYWDLELLRGVKSLLNPETGQLHEVQLQALGPSPLPQGGGQAERYRLRNGELDIDLWYQQGQWVALQSILRDGATLRYRLAREDQG